MAVADVAVADTNTKGPASPTTPAIKRPTRPTAARIVTSCARIGSALRLGKARQGARRLSSHARLTVIGRNTATPPIQARRLAYSGAWTRPRPQAVTAGV